MIVDCGCHFLQFFTIDLADWTIYTTAMMPIRRPGPTSDHKIFHLFWASRSLAFFLSLDWKSVSFPAPYFGRICLTVVIRASILGVELAVSDVLGEAGHVLPVVVHPLHAARQRPARRQVQRLQSWAAVQQLCQSLQAHPSSIQVQLPESIG